MKCIYCSKTMKHHIGAELLCPGQAVFDLPRRRYTLTPTNLATLVGHHMLVTKEEKQRNRVARSIKKQLDINQPKKRK